MKNRGERDTKKKRSRKGKPHWTEYRVNLSSVEYKNARDNLEAAFKNSTQYFPSIWGCYQTKEFWRFVSEQVVSIGARVVYDLRLSSNAIQLDDDATLVAFKLQWNVERHHDEKHQR